MATQLEGRTAARFVLRCWGDFAIVHGASGADMRPRGRKARALLAYLAMHPDKPVSREKLAGLLWGERGEEQARASLRQALFELKDFANGAGLLAVDREAVTLVDQALETDLDAIAALADAGDAEALLAALPEPDDLLFANLDGIDPGFDDWLRVERTRRRDALAALIADASAGALATGRTRAARALHARLAELTPQPGRVAEPPVAAVPALSEAVAAPPRRDRRAVLAALLTGAVGVGAAVSFGLGGRATAPSREVLNLVATAREVVYQRRFSQYPMATDLLRRTLVLHPDHPPALADLGALMAMGSRTPEEMTEGERLVRRAIALDPNLAAAHGALGMVLGFDTAEARASIKKAAALDPNSPEILFWLSNVYMTEGNYSGRLAALRRAVKADPTWHRATGTAAQAAAEMGHLEEAEGYERRLREVDRRMSFECAYAIDWSQGRYADIVLDTLQARPALKQADAADHKLGHALLVLDEKTSARLLLRLPEDYWRVASGGPPSREFFRKLNADGEREAMASDFFPVALRQVLDAGRAGEVAALYDLREGRARSLKRADVSAGGLLGEGVSVALALRMAGRRAEGEALLARVDRAVERSLGLGAVPHWFYVAVAELRATQGRRDEAIAALAMAVERGWHYAPRTAGPDIADIPAFRPLSGEPRFEALRARLKAHLAAEKRKLGAVRI